MNSQYLAGIFAFGVALNPSVGLCQSVSPEAQTAYAERAGEAALQMNKEGARLLSEGSPNDRAMAGFSKANFQLAAEEGETELSVAFSIDLENYDPEKTRDNFFRVSRTKLGITASAPIDESKNFSKLFAGDQLVDGSKLKISISRFSNSLGNGQGALPMLRDAYTACIRTEAQAWQRGQAESARAKAASEMEAFISTFSQRSGQPNFSYEIALESAADGAATGTIANHVDTQCRPSDTEGHKFGDDVQLVDTHTTLGKNFADRFYTKSSFLTFMGADASIGRQSYNFLDRTAFATDSTSKTSWEVGAFIGAIKSDLTLSARARFVYGKTFKSPDDAEICHAVVGSLAPHCVTGPDGQPIASKTGLISVETRHLFAINDNVRIAVSPQATYRFEDDNFGIEVPIYLAPDAGSKLNAGLKFAYNNKGDEFGVGLFVGVPFSIFFE